MSVLEFVRLHVPEALFLRRGAVASELFAAAFVGVVFMATIVGRFCRAFFAADFMTRPGFGFGLAAAFFLASVFARASFTARTSERVTRPSLLASNTEGMIFELRCELRRLKPIAAAAVEPGSRCRDDTVAQQTPS
eukprot:CAMPEP_0179312792 /NCGR_PEP_ID=MMETSP0797-20121207/53462_1 /TAXON_ID=47934 /ORGANISM="Dinophysis acuminata, Strain DAEP01" /LENGTH=135 /DNA_ID=CAMNT_0021022763 /DNA_START=33 /DNA_END=437 /DNA_ORIENTATION=-